MGRYLINEEERNILDKAYDLINRLADKTVENDEKQFELLRAGIFLLGVILDTEVEG